MWIYCLCISPHVPTIYNCISIEPGFCKGPPLQTEFLFLKTQRDNNEKNEEWCHCLCVTRAPCLSHYHCSSCCPWIVNTASPPPVAGLRSPQWSPGLPCDWSIQVTWPEHWPVIGHYWSRDLKAWSLQQLASAMASGEPSPAQCYCPLPQFLAETRNIALHWFTKERL